jgi:hypothetical protein
MQTALSSRPGAAMVCHGLVISALLLGARDAAAQERFDRFPVAEATPVDMLSSTRLPVREVPVTDRTIERDRNDAMINGALILAGAVGVVDNVVFHWILGWHRIIEDHPHALELEIAVVAVSAAMLAAGIIRERRARR